MHLNHPNFGYGVTHEDIAAAVSEQFFEVYNGHPSVNHLGDEEHPSVERLWDLANTIRVCLLDAQLLYGLGTDDSHEYHGEPGSHPGRGWIMVRAPFLTPEYLIRAMKAGDFYASSGVRLKEVTFDSAKGTLQIVVDPDPTAEYKIEFIASLKPANMDGKTLPPPEEIGKVVATVAGQKAEYRMQGTSYMCERS